MVRVSDYNKMGWGDKNKRMSSLIAFWYHLGINKILFKVDAGEREEITSQFQDF